MAAGSTPTATAAPAWTSASASNPAGNAATAATAAAVPSQASPDRAADMGRQPTRGDGADLAGSRRPTPDGPASALSGRD